MRLSLPVALIAGACAAGSAHAELVFGVTLNQSLITFDSATPGSILSGVPIMGLQPNETIHGIDIRPGTGQLHALGSFSRLYTINPATGHATQVGPAFASPLNGSSFGFDFNPTVDRIRVISDADQNLRLHPDTAGVTVDTPLAYVPTDPNAGVNPNAVAAAYTNSRPGATSTTLFVLDTGLDILAVQNPANSGMLTTIGPVGTDLSDFTGFDISGFSGNAFAAVRDVSLARTTFWNINLGTGAGSMIDEVGGGAILTAMTVAPAPGTLALLAGLPFLSRRARAR